MDSCKQYERLIGVYLDSELDALQVKQLLEHVKGCDACQRCLEEGRVLTEVIREHDGLLDLPNHEMWIDRGMQAVRRGAMIRVTTRWAAAAACVLLGCSVFLVMTNPENSQAIPDNWERMALVQDKGIPTETFEHPSGEIELAMLLISNDGKQEEAGHD